MSSEDIPAATEPAGRVTRPLIHTARIPDGFGLERRFAEAADPFTARYLALAPTLHPYTVEFITVLGGEDIFLHAIEFHPGYIIRNIGIVPIATFRDGNTICVHVTTGKVFYVGFLWTNEDEPDQLFKVYDRDADTHWEKGPLTVEEIQRRDGFLFPSLVEFFAFIDRVRFDIYDPENPEDPQDDRIVQSLRKWEGSRNLLSLDASD